jgi:hypothetical protein
MSTAQNRAFEQDRASEHSRVFYLRMALILGSVLVGSRYLEPARLPVICAFRLVTGLPCLTCGMTRAFHAISLGHFREAVAYHPLSPVFYGLTIFHFIVASSRFLGWRTRLLAIQEPVRLMVRGSLGLLFACWIARLLAILLS